VTEFNGIRSTFRHTARMKRNSANALLAIAAFLLAGVANADVWRWTDPLGDVHYVDTLTPIYVWLDDEGKVWYADSPDHEDAVAVQLVWHSAADSAEDAQEKEEPKEERGEKWAYQGETAEDRLKREQAEDYYCERAQQVYDSYLNAPRLYRTNEAGEREYLSDEESAATLADTKARVDELCNT
jgi:hypothetical protein